MRTIGGLRWSYVESTSTAIGTDIYNIVLMAAYRGDSLVFNFNPTNAEFAVMEPRPRASIASIGLAEWAQTGVKALRDPASAGAVRVEATRPARAVQPQGAPYDAEANARFGTYRGRKLPYTWRTGVPEGQNTPSVMKVDHPLRDPRDFRPRATFAVGVAGVLALMPFAINHLVQGNGILAASSIGVVLLLSVNSWVIARGRYVPSLTLLTLVPAIILELMIVLHFQGIIGALWCYPSLILCYFMLPERPAWIANGALLLLVVPQFWWLLDPSLAARLTATLLAVSGMAAVFMRVISNQQTRLQSLAVTDSLTGLLNRRLLYETLEQAIELGRRGNLPMTLLAIDIDHFKAINDELGHDTGDEVLRDIAALIRQRMRRSDRVFRSGGEEFLVVLFSTPLPSAHRAAQDLIDAIGGSRLIPGRAVTVSIGVAELAAADDYGDWLKRADENLYQAKKLGRNRLVG